MREWTRRVRITVDEELRRAIAYRQGDSGMATIRDTVEWVVQNGEGAVPDALYEYHQDAVDE